MSRPENDHVGEEPGAEKGADEALFYHFSEKYRMHGSCPIFVPSISDQITAHFGNDSHSLEESPDIPCLHKSVYKLPDNLEHLRAR
jgi:hypothetical protein